MSTTVDLGKITASVTVGTTTTGAAGTNASVSNSGTTQDAVLNFTIPRGEQGVQGQRGSTGPAGPAGPTGPQGPMGDVAVITPEQQAAFTMYSEPGQNTNGPMTQKAVTDNFAEIGDGSSDSDLDIDDEDGNAIVRFGGGHVLTKNFNSADAVMNGLVGSQIKRYKRQADDYYIFNNVGLVGNWVKRTLNGTPVVSSYSWGSELLFQVKRTTSVSANFILDSITAPVIAYQVDDGEWSTTNVASTISIATGLNAYEHTIRIRISSCTLNETMYTNGSGMVNFSGLTVDSNALVIPLNVNNRKILFIGDSITGGVGSSVWQGYAYLLADMLNAANIQSALAGVGLVHGSRTYLPTASQVLREMIQGSNNAVNEPDVIFIMLGTNDGSQTSAANFKIGYSNLLKYIRKRFGGCHIFACSPFNGTHQADTQAATQVIDNVTWIPTTALAGTYTTSDGTHPDVAGAKVCADYCYEKITEVLYLNYFN